MVLASLLLAAQHLAAPQTIDLENILVYTVPPVFASLLALVGTVWVAKLANRNSRQVDEVRRKVTTPGDGTLGEKVQKVVEHTGADGGT